MLLPCAILTPSQHWEQLGKDADPGLEDLATPLAQHLLRQVEDQLCKLLVQYLHYSMKKMCFCVNHHIST